MTQNISLTETPRTTQIATMLFEGKTHEYIAQHLNVSRSTVERELRELRTNDIFLDWAIGQFLQLHPSIMEKYPLECYRVLAQVIKRGAGDTNITQTNISQIRVVFGDNLQVVDAVPVTIKDTVGNDHANPVQPEEQHDDTTNT
jgi:DNA-binding transcriptional regulator LsrR (DeoR family)